MQGYHDDARDTKTARRGNLPWLKADVIMIFEPQDIVGGVRLKYDDDHHHHATKTEFITYDAPKKIMMLMMRLRPFDG